MKTHHIVVRLSINVPIGKQKTILTQMQITLDNEKESSLGIEEHDRNTHRYIYIYIYICVCMYTHKLLKRI